jgi:hypothetical protein
MNDRNTTPTIAPGFGAAPKRGSWTIRIGESNGEGAYAWQEVAPVHGPDGKPVLLDGGLQWKATGPYGTLTECAAWELNHNPRVRPGLVVSARIDGEVPTLYFQAGACS